MLKNPLHKVCLLRCGELHVVVPVTDLVSIELAEDIQPILQKDSPSGSVEGIIALRQGNWRVILLDPQLTLQHYLSKTHRFVACLRATEFGANGFLCDEAITLTDQHANQTIGQHTDKNADKNNFVALPGPMHSGQQVFQQLMRYENTIALVSDAQRLGAYCAKHTQPSTDLNTPQNTSHKSPPSAAA